MRAGGGQDGGVRRWAVGLALLALIVQVLTPPGFMMARQGDRAVLMICTGHGAADSPSDLMGHPGKAPQSRHDAPCAFAGLGVSAAPPLLDSVGPATTSAVEAPSIARLDLMPGRGLAAPPPPSHGPPQLAL
jgi:hypothetical protein